MSYSQHIGAGEMKRCLGTVRDLMDNLKPGFLLLTDLSNLESMEASCAPDLGAIMDLCSAKGILSVVQVIPDSNKDIGFDLISRFHHDPPVKTQTHESLAAAIKGLQAAILPPAALVDAASPNEIDRKKEDELAEVHFTVAARKEIEVNEGGAINQDSPS